MLNSKTAMHAAKKELPQEHGYVFNFFKNLFLETFLGNLRRLVKTLKLS